ncbi:23 kDa jasmonate-induced protein-like [Pyrus ussuriensis x Pyrus communis]|uniref:23 kDa jasmonate-induced protein-like n=1 Tax=Pyrus ussuriensis x Pyrus communis TaxID=2448454 RepID=A0A5N5G3X9_9ROSA|nr:23 kDa jasmonate-induced protein-like [Pyrus ussuriensis x Pyrus communis]
MVPTATICCLGATRRTGINGTTRLARQVSGCLQGIWTSLRLSCRLSGAEQWRKFAEVNADGAWKDGSAGEWCYYS